MKFTNISFIFLLLLIGGAGNFAYSQYRGPITPPPLLKENFEKDFPEANANSDTWWEETSTYIVDFKQNSYSMKGFFPLWHGLVGRTPEPAIMLASNTPPHAGQQIYSDARL